VVVVALLAILAGAVMLRTAFAPVPDPRDVIGKFVGDGSTQTGPGGYPAPSGTITRSGGGRRG
jgi:hypothetical protein